MPSVAAIHIAPGSRLPMKSVDQVTAEAGLGLVGDRYHGTRHRHVSVQSASALAEASALLGMPIAASGTRRNLTLTDGEIPRKPGTRLTIGPVELEVVRVAAPCRLLDDVIGTRAARALHHPAASICRILSGGVIHVGDAAEWSLPEEISEG